MALPQHIDRLNLDFNAMFAELAIHTKQNNSQFHESCVMSIFHFDSVWKDTLSFLWDWFMPILEMVAFAEAYWSWYAPVNKSNKIFRGEINYCMTLAGTRNHGNRLFFAWLNTDWGNHQKRPHDQNKLPESGKFIICRKTGKAYE